MKLAMEEAGAQPEQIDYINAHGTSTHHNDLYETRAIRYALGAAADQVVVNSTKSIIGHLLGAAGGVEFVTCVKSIQDGFIHQTMGTKETEEECSLDYAIGAPVEKEITYALTNSLGFGGHNASLLLKNMKGSVDNMKFEQLVELIQTVSSSNLGEFKYEEGDFKISLKKKRGSQTCRAK